MQKSILEKAAVLENWQSFLQYKIEKQHLSGDGERAIRSFIDEKKYLPLCKNWENNSFPADFPEKKLVNKGRTGKKRVVYSFPGEESIFLKFIAFWLYQYDEKFSRNCYAFRHGYGVRDAVKRILGTRKIGEKYCLKVDIQNYFNSIDIERLLEKLDFVKKTDEPLYRLFERLLREKRVYENGEITEDNHGAMAGIPVAPFFANVYLKDVDDFFEQEGVLYFRYSDDILLFADSLTELEQRKKQLYEKIKEHGLELNPDKVSASEPGQSWEFLGFCYREGVIDLSENTKHKTKQRIKRKADALRRWQRQKELAGEKAAVGFIRAMNRKFYGAESEDDFTWSRWFFPNLTTDSGLREIDAYMQEYIRYAVTGRHYKGNYRIKYDTMKAWGYRSLVHEYYGYKKRKEAMLP